MAGAAYYREWRKSHPEYRARERERSRRRKARMTPEERRQSRGSRRATEAASDSTPLPPLHQGHILFERAKSICAKDTPGFVALVHPYFDDLLSEVVLALIEHRDPGKARTDFLRGERAWARRALQECKWSID